MLEEKNPFCLPYFWGALWSDSFCVQSPPAKITRQTQAFSLLLQLLCFQFKLCLLLTPPPLLFSQILSFSFSKVGWGATARHRSRCTHSYNNICSCGKVPPVFILLYQIRWGNPDLAASNWCPANLAAIGIPFHTSATTSHWVAHEMGRDGMRIGHPR